MMRSSLLLRSTAQRFVSSKILTSSSNVAVVSSSASFRRPWMQMCLHFFSTHRLKDSYEYVTVEKKNEGAVALITLNRPKALNALCDDLFTDLIHAATALDKDEGVGCLVLTGSPKAFAAGADISEMKDRTFDYAYQKVSSSEPVCLPAFYLFGLVYVLKPVSNCFYYKKEHVQRVGRLYQNLQAGDCRR